MERNKSFSIDLSRIRGTGKFKCPKCGVTISPDDFSEDVYTVLQPVMKKNRLEKIVLQCNRCGSTIHLIGLDFLEELS